MLLKKPSILTETEEDTQNTNSSNEGLSKITKPLNTRDLKKVFFGILVTAVVLGLFSGYSLAKKPTSNGLVGSLTTASQPKTAAQDTRTFRDFAEGIIEPQPKPKNPTDYVEGTHLLKREGTTPVTLTSSVVDLSQYEGKKVKVLGETQKAVKAGWLMDVGKVEELE